MRAQLRGEIQTSPRGQGLVHRNGAVYTPRSVADFVARKTLGIIASETEMGHFQGVSVVDPAVGDGMLLRSFLDAVRSSGKTIALSLCGVDKNRRALTACIQALGDGSPRTTRLVLRNANSLLPGRSSTLQEWWDGVSMATGSQGKFDVLIANPPWGADMSGYLPTLKSRGEFSVLNHQVDSFELFVELSMKIVRRGGYFALIVPDAILNHGKSPIRELLLSKSQVKYVARLGEGLFPGVYRGCAVVIGKNAPPSRETLTTCFRLRRSDRARVVEGTRSLSEVETQSLHVVRQARFSRNPNWEIDIDLREAEADLLAKVRASHSTLGQALVGTRGVELGKTGWVCRCPRCSTYSPMPTRRKLVCRSCGSSFDLDQATRTQIIQSRASKGAVPLIIGSDLKRYSASPSKWILLGKEGINYKLPETFGAPKLLVRKTGVGITSAIDYAGCYTTQVVYIFRTAGTSQPALEFFLGLLNSRLYYFILSKSFGEVEWRTHPYLTQSQILGLPLPDLNTARNRAVAHGVSQVVRRAGMRNELSPRQDLQIESLVGRLFGLSLKDYGIVFDALDQADELLPVKALKTVDYSDLTRLLN